MVEPSGKKVKKVIGGKNIPKNVHVVPLENVTFHYKESVAKWNFFTIKDPFLRGTFWLKLKNA